jgi:hypothetical protein
MVNRIFISFLILFSSIVYNRSFAQATLHGPACTVPGTEYQYNIGGLNTSDSTVSICLQGGVMAGTVVRCQYGLPVPMIRVVWKDTAAGVINLSWSGGNTSLTVGITRPLQGGAIDSAAAWQTVQSGTIISTIHCSPATGGSCISGYVYQWEQSPDNITWAPVANNAGANLAVSVALTQTTWYRRKVMVSNSVAYSNVAAVIVLR